MLTWQSNARSTYQATERLEESRQHYATVRIQEFQRTFSRVSFYQLAVAFRSYGDLYDQGCRLRDGMEGAA